MTELDTAEIRARFQADEDGVYMAIPLLCARVESLTEQRDILLRDLAQMRRLMALTWTEQEIREAYDHGSTAGVCEDVDDIISALHYRFHAWSEPCCSSPDEPEEIRRGG